MEVGCRIKGAASGSNEIFAQRPRQQISQIAQLNLTLRLSFRNGMAEARQRVPGISISNTPLGAGAPTDSGRPDDFIISGKSWVRPATNMG